jgi:membrane-associated phospholipid phosphatase
VRTGDVLSVTTATAFLLIPRIVRWGPETPSCTVPCDRASLPFFDRWAVGGLNTTWARTSDVLVVGLAAGTIIGIGTRDGGGPYAVAAIEAGLWSEAATEWLKTTGRERPVLYTEEGVAVQVRTDNLRSFPSGHTSVAFALATSHWLARRDLNGTPGLWGWLGFAGAAGVGVARVAAGKHFPSDVVGGAALGVLTGVLVHSIKF